MPSSLAAKSHPYNKASEGKHFARKDDDGCRKPTKANR